MENQDSNQPTSGEERPQLSTWQDYYQYAQQLFEAGRETEAEQYHAIAQKLYEASEDEIAAEPEPQPEPQSEPQPQQASAPQAQPQAGGDIYAAQQAAPQAVQQAAPQTVQQVAPQAVQQAAPQPAPAVSRPSMNDFSEINSVKPSIAPEAAEPRVSKAALDDWATEYSSMHPEQFDHHRHARKRKAMIFAAIGAAVVIGVVVGVYLHMQSKSNIIQTTAPVSQSDTTVEDDQFKSSKPSSIHNSWDRQRPPGAVRGPRQHKGRSGGGGGGGAKAESNDNMTSPKGKKTKKLNNDPLANFEL